MTKTTDIGPGVVYNSGLGLSSGAPSSPVEVISQNTVGVYSTAVLKAADENSLAKWLTDNGYSFPSTGIQSLKSYVDEGWYFAIAKIKPDSVGGGITTQLATGTLTPLRLTFKTDKIIYPMKLTAVALSQTVPSALASPTSGMTTRIEQMGNIPITLYVLADHRTDHAMLTTNWAKWIGGADIKTLNDGLGASIISGDKVFLTKMSATLNVGDITDDFTITAFNSNDQYPASPYKTAAFWWENLLFFVVTPLVIIFFPFPIGLIFMVFMILQKYVKKKWLYVSGLIYEILACLILTLIGLIILLENSSDLSTLLQANGFIGAMISGVALLVLGIYVIIRKIKGYKKV